MKTLLLVTAVGASLACGTVHAECIVADPSPTPLNIRTAPYGRVVSTIRNSIEVNIFDRSSDSHGREWVFVGIGDLPLGWVYRDLSFARGNDSSETFPRARRFADASREAANRFENGGTHMKRLIIAVGLALAPSQGGAACKHWTGGVLSGKCCADVSHLTQRCIATAPDGYTFEATAYTSDGKICGHGAGCMAGVKFLTPCNVKSDLYNLDAP